MNDMHAPYLKQVNEDCSTSPVPIVIQALLSLSIVYLATASKTATATLPRAMQNTPKTSSFVALLEELGSKGSRDAPSSSSEGGRMDRLSAHTLNLVEIIVGSGLCAYTRNGMTLEITGMAAMASPS